MNLRIPGRRFLHSPGPTHVPDEVLDAMRRQPMDLADPRVNQTIEACETGLRQLVQSRQGQVLIFAANGHGAWEATIENLLAPGQQVLIPGTGHFSDSWALQTNGLGRVAVRTPWTPGLPIDALAVEQVLREDHGHHIAAVFAVHTDTASGVTSDVPALRRAIDAAGHPALLVVDVVASLGATVFSMDDWGVNVAVGASQKGLMVPPGLGLVVADERAMAVAAANLAPRFYWDWGRRAGSLSYQKFCGTPPQALLAGLAAALDLIALEGLTQVQARHRLLASAVHAAVDAWREGGAVTHFCPEPAARSVSVTAVRVEPGIDPEALRTVARERFQVAIAGGLGPLAGKAFRIGHLGDLNPAMILGCLGGVEAAMTVQGIPFGSGGLARAIAVLAQG